MKKLFSLNFYIDSLKRIRTISIVFSAIVVLGTVFGALPHLMQYISSLVNPSAFVEQKTLSLVDIVSSAGGLVTVFIPIITLFAFAYLFKRNESDFYGALPYGKEVQLVSACLAVFSVAVFTLLLSSSVGIVLLAPCLGKTVEYRFLKGLFELLGLILCSATSISVTALAVSVTGTVANGALVSFAVAYAPRAILVLINSSVEALCPTLMRGHAIPLFDNSYNMLSALFFGSTKTLTSPVAFVYTAILCILYIGLGYYLFKRRKSEYATHSFANRLFRHITSVLLSLLTVALGIYLVCLDLWFVFFSVFIFALAVGIYFAYSLVTGRKERDFVGTLVAFAALIGASAVLALTVFLSSMVFNSYAPTSSEIKSVSILAPEIDDWYNYLDYPSYVAKRAENITLTDKESKEIVERAVKRGADIDNYTSYTAVNLRIKTSFNSYRSLYLTNEEYSKLVTKLAENKEYETLWLNVSDGASDPWINDSVNINGESAERILSILEDEVAEVGFDAWFSANSGGEAVVTLSYYAEIDGETVVVSLPITKQMKKTYDAYLTERRVASEKLLSDISLAIDSAFSGNGEALSVSVNLTTSDKNTYWIDAYISEGEQEIKQILDELLSELSTEYVEDDDTTVYLSLFGDGFYTESYYGIFKVREESAQKILLLFKQYGETYID